MIPVAPKVCIDMEMRMPLTVNKVVYLTEAFLLVVSYSCFCGRLIHYEGSERQNV